MYQRGNQNQKIEEGQTTHWPKEKEQKNIRAQHIWSRLNSYVLRHEHIINDYAGTSFRRSVASGYIYVFLAPKITIKLFHFVDIYFSGAGAAYPSGRTDNTLAKRKRTKEQTTIYKTYT
jgi:hypothetical protein